MFVPRVHTPYNCTKLSYSFRTQISARIGLTDRVSLHQLKVSSGEFNTHKSSVESISNVEAGSRATLFRSRRNFVFLNVSFVRIVVVEYMETIYSCSSSRHMKYCVNALFVQSSSIILDI